MCHLPRGALEGSGVFGERGRRFLRAGEGGQGEGDYEALCSLVSLVSGDASQPTNCAKCSYLFLEYSQIVGEILEMFS